MFHKKAQFVVPRVAADGDRSLGFTLDARAEEITPEDNLFILISPQDRFHAVPAIIGAGSIMLESQKLTSVPDDIVAVTAKPEAAQTLQLHEALEDFDDVPNVHSKFNASQDVPSRVHA